MKKSPKISVCITLDKEVKEKMQAVAKENCRSLSRQINRALKRFLAQWEETK